MRNLVITITRSTSILVLSLVVLYYSAFWFTVLFPYMLATAVVLGTLYALTKALWGHFTYRPFPFQSRLWSECQIGEYFHEAPEAKVVWAWRSTPDKKGYINSLTLAEDDGQFLLLVSTVAVEKDEYMQWLQGEYDRELSCRIRNQAIHDALASKLEELGYVINYSNEGVVVEKQKFYLIVTETDREVLVMADSPKEAHLAFNPSGYEGTPDFVVYSCKEVDPKDYPHLEAISW